MAGTRGCLTMSALASWWGWQRDRGVGEALFPPPPGWLSLGASHVPVHSGDGLPPIPEHVHMPQVVDQLLPVPYPSPDPQPMARQGRFVDEWHHYPCSGDVWSACPSRLCPLRPHQMVTKACVAYRKASEDRSPCPSHTALLMLCVCISPAIRCSPRRVWPTTRPGSSPQG